MAQDALQAWMLGQLARTCLRMGHVREMQRLLGHLPTLQAIAGARVRRALVRDGERLHAGLALAVARQSSTQP